MFALIDTIGMHQYPSVNSTIYSVPLYVNNLI